MDALNTFFEAWAETDAKARLAAITAAVSPECIYSDPRSGDRLRGPQAIADYVGMFSANAPGWSATVDKTDTVNGYYRAIVAFGGKGPDGTDMVQHGTYFADANDAGQLTMIAGFVGTGAAT